MQHQAFNLYNAFAKSAFDAGRQLADINGRAYERLAKRQIELASDFMESGIKQFVSHYVAAQKDFAQEYVSKAQAANEDTVKLISQAQDELNRYLEQQLPAAIEQVKSAVRNAAQEAVNSTRAAAGKKAA
jgi:hypothetical protein